MNEQNEGYSLSFYYPGSSAVRPDGILEVPASWWDSGSHSSGMLLVSPEDPDYPLWRWLTNEPERFPQVSDENMAMVREAFAQRHDEPGEPTAWTRD
jgi:hypothetical protein